jgi:hypothetical protein
VLDGREALWYGRSRYGSDDYDRMGRQKCLMSYMLEQLSPRTVLFNAEEIAASSTQMMSTDIPAEDLPRFVDLASKARESKISTVSLVPPAVSVTAPDFARIHQMIGDAINASEAGTETADPEPVATAESAPVGPVEVETAGIAKTHPRVANQAGDLTHAC